MRLDEGEVCGSGLREVAQGMIVCKHVCVNLKTCSQHGNAMIVDAVAIKMQLGE